MFQVPKKCWAEKGLLNDPFGEDPCNRKSILSAVSRRQDFKFKGGTSSKLEFPL
jgi:hypothetical protein